MIDIMKEVDISLIYILDREHFSQIWYYFYFIRQLLITMKYVWTAMLVYSVCSFVHSLHQKYIKYKPAVVRGTTNPAACCHLANDTDLLTPVIWAMAGDNKQIKLWPELTQNVIRSSHGQSKPFLKISCKSVQPFSRNVADKETKKQSVGFGWLVDEVVWACAIVVLSVDVDIWLWSELSISLYQVGWKAE